eukprot:365909-Chlamydomonas_euryale.AAC.2
MECPVPWSLLVCPSATAYWCVPLQQLTGVLLCNSLLACPSATAYWRVPLQQLTVVSLCNSLCLMSAPAPNFCVPGSPYAPQPGRTSEKLNVCTERS